MISKMLLERALDMVPIASDDPARCSINGVLIRSKGGKVTLVATNGHMLVERVYEAACPEGEYMLRADAVKALKIVLNEHRFQDEIDCSIDLHKGLFIGSDVGTKARIEGLSQEYPDYKAVIPTHLERVSIALNANYLAAIGKVFTDGEKRAAPSVRIEFDPAQPTKAILVFSENENGAVGVVMPRRDLKASAIARDYAASKAPAKVKKVKVAS